MTKKTDSMNISASDAEEALAAIETITQKTRQSIASGGTYITLIITGVVWFVGFTCTQFLLKEIVGYIWAGLSILGGVIGTFLGIRMGKRVRSPATNPTMKRVVLFWLLLVGYAITIIAIAHPSDGKQATLFVILFMMIGQLAMGLVFSFSSVWWAVPITLLALAGYFLFPGIFYLWMAILGGGGMIVLGLYILYRW